MKPTASLNEYRRAFAYLTPYWKRLMLVLFISLVSTLLGLAQPYITKLLIDEALLRRNLNALWQVAALMVAVTVLSFALNILSSYRYVSVSAEVLFDMRLALYRHLQTLSPRFYARTRLGDIVSRLNNDIAEIQRVAADSLLAVLANVVFFIGSVAIMLWLNWRLFLLSIALVPPSVLALRHYQSRLTGQVKSLRERSADIGSFLIESLQGLRLIVTSRAEAHEVARFRARNRGFIEALLAMQLTSYLAGALPGAMLTLSTALVFLYGGALVIKGSLSIGALVAFMAYHQRLLAPVQSLMSLYTNLTTARVSLRRVFELLDTPPDVIESPHAVPLDRARGEIRFDRVSFRHDRETVVLDEVSFTIAAGSITAITGGSGAGKSTIADLMVRLFDPQAGAIELDGTICAPCGWTMFAVTFCWWIKRRSSLTPELPKTLLTVCPRLRRKKSPPLRKLPRWISSSPVCRKVTTRRSANAAWPFPQANASDWPLRVRCCANRRCWCWTNPAPRSTPPPNKVWPRRFRNPCAVARQSSSRIARRWPPSPIKY